MATFAEIKSIRLQIDDPVGFIDILNVATLALLPAVPPPQTVYLVDEDGSYMATEKVAGAAFADYERQELLFSDEALGNLIDLYGVANVLCYVYRQALVKIANRLTVLQVQTGTETVEYVSMTARYRAYKDLLNDCENQAAIVSGTNTGQWLQTNSAEIAGGDL